MKWDGVCVIGYVQDGTTRLMSRNDLDVSVSYPEVLDAPDPVRATFAADPVSRR